MDGISEPHGVFIFAFSRLPEAGDDGVLPQLWRRLYEPVVDVPSALGHGDRVRKLFKLKDCEKTVAASDWVAKALSPE